jgi:chorismate-pyruvate lyase
MPQIFNVKNHHLITIDDIYKLEKISDQKFDLVQRILLIDLGNTQQLLDILNNTKTQIRVLSQVEERDIIKRKSCIISSTNDILAYANSKIYSRKMPFDVLEEIRECKKGIGKIILYHQLEIFKKITEIGYVPGKYIFKNYSLFHMDHRICRINEIFPIQTK